MDEKLIESAEHWESLAAAAERGAAWDRERGLDLSMPGSSPGDHKARLFRRSARALRLEYETGIPHCAEHDPPVPRQGCVHCGKGLRV